MERRIIAPPIYLKNIPFTNRESFMYWQSPSHEGWLIILCDFEAGEEPNEISWKWKRGDCFLWKPVTSQTILLPSLISFMNEYQEYPYSSVLSSSPTNPDSMVLFLFRGQDSSCLVFCCPGERRWRKQQYSLFAHYLFCFKGTNKLCIMSTSHDKIYLIEKLEPQMCMNLLSLRRKDCHPAEEAEGTFGINVKYVDCCDELFKVVRGYHPSSYFSRMFYIKVSRFDFSSNEVSWEEVKSMGNHVLFIIGENTLASCSAAELGLKKGCVYFTHYRDESLYKFDLEDDSIYFSLPYPSDLLVPSSLQDWVRIVDGRRDDIFRNEEGNIMLEPIGNSTIDNIQSTPMYPNLIFVRKEHPIWNCIDPINNNYKYELNLSGFLSDATIWFSKGGWLLMSRGKSQIYFLNPFTRAWIRLPDLQNYYIFYGMSFSSLPTSSDCVVFAIAEQPGGLVCISISRGEKSWRYDIFDDIRVPSSPNYLEFKISVNNPVFFEGVFYCLDLFGSLGVFEKGSECKWKILGKPEREPINCILEKSFLVECQGELYSVFLGHLGKQVFVRRLDSNKNWVEVNSLQKHMLFISDTSSISLVAPHSSMENKIFFARLCHGDKILCYSLDTCMYSSFGSHHSARNFYNTKVQLNCSWIEPNWSYNTYQELDWYKN